MSEDQPNPEAELDIYFQPVVQLKEVKISTQEENEDEVFKIRAKLFRFDDSDPTSIEWKERGTGDIRLLKHRDTSRTRIVMRREQTLKLCCNHYLTKSMLLKPHCNSERSFVWSTPADFADNEPVPEVLAVRFRDAEAAGRFKRHFENCQRDLPSKSETESCETEKKEADSSSDKENASDGKAAADDEEKENEAKGGKGNEDLANKMSSLAVRDNSTKPDSTNSTDQA